MARNVRHAALLLVLILSLLAAWLAWSADRSHACSCRQPGSPSEELERSAAVFAGRVVSIDDSLVLGSSLAPLIVEFEIETVWKGLLHRRVELKTASDTASCGFSFVEGGEYLVYSRSGRETSYCSRTRPLARAGDDLKELGPGKVPVDGQTTATPTTPEQSAGGGCGPSSQGDLVLAMGLVFGVAWATLRKRHPHDP